MTRLSCLLSHLARYLDGGLVIGDRRLSHPLMDEVLSEAGGLRFHVRTRVCQLGTTGLASAPSAAEPADARSGIFAAQ